MLQNLKKLRDKHGVSQQRLATAIGVSQQSINKYENHNIEPDIRTLVAMANYFCTSVDYIVGRTDPETDEEFFHAQLLSQEERNLIREYRDLTERERESIRLILENYQK